jgi:hypothetical protein
MSMKAVGEFDVKMSPVTERSRDGLSNGLFLLEKSFRGDLSAAGLGEVLTGMGSVEGAASYVAIEKITGTLNGLSGSFMLAHKASMSAAEQTMDISVVPDSGTDELQGIDGLFFIKIDAGKHFYEFDYTLGDQQQN